MRWIYLAAFVAFCSAWVRGYPAIGAEIMMLLIPIVIWAFRYQERREAVFRRYREKMDQEAKEKEAFLHEIRISRHENRKIA